MYLGSYLCCMMLSLLTILSIDGHHYMVHFLTLNVSWCLIHKSLNMYPTIPNFSKYNPLKIFLSISSSNNQHFFSPGQLFLLHDVEELEDPWHRLLP